MEKLLKVRKAMKKRKPKFVQTDTHWKKRIKAVWRKPRGVHNKMRLNHSSYPRVISIGWRGPKAVRGLSSEGKKIVVVSNLTELKAQDKNTVVEIKATVGKKKRIQMMQEAKKMGLRVKNVKSVDTALDKISKAFTARKAARKKWQQTQTAKATKKKTAKKEEKKSIEETVDKDKEKKDQEKTLKKRI